jgi:hypothetical protein
MRMSLVFLALVLAGTGSLAAQSPTKERTRTATTEATAAAVVSLEQFQGFRWITGRWRGTGNGPLSSVPTFYEEYAMLDDSTMRMRTFEDSTFTTITDSSRFELRGGRVQVRSANGNAGVVTRWAGDSVQFGPPFRTLYLRISGDLWRASFPPRSSGGTVPSYDMRRVGKAP